MALQNAQQRAGAFAMIAKYGPGFAPAAMRNAKRAKLLNEVDPHGMLSEAERNQRADALQKSRMILMSQKGVDAKRRKASEKANKIIEDVVSPAGTCAWCGPIGRTQTHQTCAKHAAEFEKAAQKWK